MGNRERVRQLKELRNTACGIGTRLLKLRLNKLAQFDPVALAARLALEIEDCNLTAKRYGPSYAGHYYFEKQRMIRELIMLFKHQEWGYGVHESDRGETKQIIYFEIPGCEQISWHYTHQGDPLPAYEKEWDGKQGSTLPKLMAFIEREFAEILKGKSGKETMKVKTNPVFDKQIADVAISRGLSRASVLCALLVASGQAHTQKIAPSEYEKCFKELANIPEDVAKSAAFNNLCDCARTTNYDADFESQRDYHVQDCLYVAWRDLIEDPLESILDDKDEEDYNDG